MQNSRPHLVETLVHGFRVLQAFTADQPALTLPQVADRARLDAATAFHLVQTLVVLGYVERISGTKQFRLTLKPLELGFHALMQQNPQRCTLGPIDKLPSGFNDRSLSELYPAGPSPSGHGDTAS